MSGTVDGFEHRQRIMMNAIDQAAPALIGGAITCALGSHAPTVIASIAAGLSRIQSVDQPDVRPMPIVIGLAEDDEGLGRHHVVSLLTQAIRGLLAEPPPEPLRTIEVFVGWPDPARPGAPPPPDVSALADCIGSRLGRRLAPSQVHLVTGSSAGAEALVNARDRMTASPEVDACLIAAADSWLTTDAMRWAESRRPLRRSVHGDGMVPAEAGVAVWLARHAATTSARLVGAASEEPAGHLPPLVRAVNVALLQGGRDVDDVAHVVLDTDCERDRLVAVAAMSPTVRPNHWTGLRWSPAECIGNVGAAAGLACALLAAHILTRHGEGGTVLALALGDTEQPVALLLSAASDPAASLEEPIPWAIE